MKIQNYAITEVMYINTLLLVTIATYLILNKTQKTIREKRNTSTLKIVVIVITTTMIIHHTRFRTKLIPIIPKIRSHKLKIKLRMLMTRKKKPSLITKIFVNW